MLLKFMFVPIAVEVRPNLNLGFVRAEGRVWQGKEADRRAADESPRA